MWQHFNCMFICIPSVINVSYRSSSAVHSLTVSLLIYVYWSDTRNSRGSTLSYTGPVIWNSLPFSVCHAWTVECQTTVISPPLFHLFPAVFRPQLISVCVDKCYVAEFLNDLGLWVYIPWLPLPQVTCYVCSLWLCCCEWLSVSIEGL